MNVSAISFNPIYRTRNQKNFVKHDIEPAKNSEIKEISFCAEPLQVNFIKALRKLMEDENFSSEVFDKIFAQIPKEKQENIQKITEYYSKFGVKRNDIIKKMLMQQGVYSQSADKMINHTDAYIFVERNKSNKPLEQIVPYVIDKKNLAQKNETTYISMLVPKIFKTSGKPDCFVDKCNLESVLKRYLRRNPDTELDTIEITDDKMVPEFIEYTKKLSREISGDDNLFNIEIVKDRVSEKPVLITENQLNPSMANILKDMRTLYSQSGKITNEIMDLYKRLPYNSRVNMTNIIRLLRAEGEEINPPALMKAAIKYPLFFRKESADSVKLIKAKRFQLRDSGKKDVTINSTLGESFNDYKPNIIYSQMLADKIFANKSSRPWYLTVKSTDLTDDIGLYLRNNRDKKITIDVINDEMTEDFIAYAKEISNRNAGFNLFDFNIIEK